MPIINLNIQPNQALVKVLMFCFMVIVSGCGTKKINLSEENKSNIPEFVVDDKVTIVNAPGYLGTEHNIGMMFGVIGALAASAATASEPAKITRYLDDQKIDIKSIVRLELIHQFQAIPRLAAKLKETAKIKIQLHIYMYGLAVKSFSSELKPTPGVKAKFVDESGTTLWEQLEWVSNANKDTPSYLYEDYFKSPDAFKLAFASAAKQVVQSLVEEMD